MWLEENRSNILSDNPDFSDEADIIREGMTRFRVLTAEERKVRMIVLEWRSEFSGLKNGNSECLSFFFGNLRHSSLLFGKEII